MTRPLAEFLVTLTVMCSLCCDVRGQDLAKSRGGQAAPKPPKAKLFEVPGLSGKLSQDTLGDVLDALRDKKVQQEIGLLPSQLKDLLRLSDDIMKELGPTVENFNTLPKAEQEARAEQLQKDLAAYMKGVQTDVDKILVPEQQQRLRQVVFQLRMQKNGAIQTFASPDVLRELGVNEAQAERFRENLTTIEEQYRRKMSELANEKERKVLALFSPNQRERLESMIGAAMPNLSKPPVGTNSPRP